VSSKLFSSAINNMDAERYAINYLKQFNDSILDCNDINDYLNLVLGAVIFSELALTNYKALYGDNLDSEDSIEKLKQTAKLIADEAVRQNKTNEELETIKLASLN